MSWYPGYRIGSPTLAIKFGQSNLDFTWQSNLGNQIWILSGNQIWKLRKNSIDYYLCVTYTNGGDNETRSKTMTTATATTKAVKAATAVEKSSNAKLGGVSATYVSQATCPKDCPFYKAGCYAELGYARYTTFRLNDSPERDVDVIAQQEANAIDALSGRRNLRLHVVGDTTTDKGARILRGAARRYKAKHGSKVWTYTHAWRKVRRASWGKPVSVLASCETPADVRLANARGYAAAIVVPHFRESKAYVHDGVKVVPCPAQTRGVSCANCLLCADGERLLANGLSIAFEAHGVRANAVRKALPVVS